jgi:hypothetical protein
MPRKGGHTPQSSRRKHVGHRMHKRGRLARQAAKANQRHTGAGWDPATTWNNDLGRWV